MPRLTPLTIASVSSAVRAVGSFGPCVRRATSAEPIRPCRNKALNFATRLIFDRCTPIPTVKFAGGEMNPSGRSLCQCLTFICVKASRHLREMLSVPETFALIIQIQRDRTGLVHRPGDRLIH